jgi:tagatose 1,6-diphosphate aldolase GatY/KbaY
MIHLIDAIKWAKENITAMPAINIFSLDFMVFIAQFSKRYNWPVIIQTSTKTVNHYGVPTIVAMFNAIKNHYGAPIFLHLDHCNNIPLINECIESGYDSIMADFSSLPVKENIREIKRIADVARSEGCLIEGEVGQLGIEDGVGSEVITHTSVKDALTFTSAGHVSLFAPVFGNAHGNYKSSSPSLDFALFKEIATSVGIPLVLHGASGLSPVQIKQCIKYGTVKINYSTVFKNIFSELIDSNTLLSIKSNNPLLFNDKLKTAIISELESIYKVLNYNRTTIG